MFILNPQVSLKKAPLSMREKLTEELFEKDEQWANEELQVALQK